LAVEQTLADKNIVTEERRKYQRIESNLPLQYKNLRKIGESPTGSLTKDLSAGGVRFRTGEFISLACRLVVEINLPTVEKPIKAISKVAWIRKVPASDSYELGNQFLEITKEDRSHVTNFVNGLLNKNP
jgi:c-di-GMP-binding flagellar brake protein YcgR